MKKLAIILSAIVCSGAFAEEKLPTYKMVLAGMDCWVASDQGISCKYSVGGSLHFSINGINFPDTSVVFLHSDINDDFYATYGVAHGCIIVKPGFPAKEAERYSGMAFVSPKSGVVYKTWEECKAGY